MNKKRQTHNICFFVLLCVCFSYCYQPQSGCLDPNAVNYDVEADDPCDDCCQAPTMNVNLRLNYDTLSFSLNQWFEFAPRDSIAFQKLEFSLSDFSVLGESQELRNQDSVTIGSLKVTSDMQFINSVSENLEVFDLGVPENITKLQFETGIPASVQDPVLESDYGTYNQIIDSLWIEQEALMGKMRLRYLLQDSVIQDDIYLYDLEDELISFELDTFTRKASNHTIIVNFDVKRWIDNIDFSSLSHDDIQPLLEDQYLSSFSIQ